MNQLNNNHSDIIIVGNGITSQFLALKLSKMLGNRIRLTIIDKQKEDNPSSEYVRALSISLSTVNLCKSLGIWELVKSKAHPINKIVISHSISDEKKTSFLNLDNRVNEEVASYVINETALREIIFQETSKLSNINLMHNNISEVKLGSDQI